MTRKLNAKEFVFLLKNTVDCFDNNTDWDNEESEESIVIHDMVKLWIKKQAITNNNMKNVVSKYLAKTKTEKLYSEKKEDNFIDDSSSSSLQLSDSVRNMIETKYGNIMDTSIYDTDKKNSIYDNDNIFASESIYELKSIYDKSESIYDFKSETKSIYDKSDSIYDKELKSEVKNVSERYRDTENDVNKFIKNIKHVEPAPTVIKKRFTNDYTQSLKY